MLGPAPNTLPLGRSDAQAGQEVYILVFRIYYPPTGFELPSVGCGRGRHPHRKGSPRHYPLKPRS